MRRSPGKIILAGGGGFIGRALASHLADHGGEVVVLTRGVGSLAGTPRFVQWDPPSLGPWSDEIAAAAAVVNLAGEPLVGLWTPAKRRRILESRIAAGNALVRAIEEAGATPVFIQASAIGFYGDRGEEELDETSPHGAGFLCQVAKAWENSTERLAQRAIRRAVVRMGVVLGPGGFLARIVPPFKAFLGTRIGSGRQWFSWVHLADVVRALQTLIQRDDLAGVFNLVAPEPVRSGEFTRVMADRLGRPVPLVLPAPLLMHGGAMMREVLLASARVVPRRLLDAGFSFDYSNIRIALQSLV